MLLLLTSPPPTLWAVQAVAQPVIPFTTVFTKDLCFGATRRWTRGQSSLLQSKMTQSRLMPDAAARMPQYAELPGQAPTLSPRRSHTSFLQCPGTKRIILPVPKRTMSIVVISRSPRNRCALGGYRSSCRISLGDSDSSALSSDSSHHRRQGIPHDAVFMMNGFPPPRPLLIQTLLDWRYPSIEIARWIKRSSQTRRTRV